MGNNRETNGVAQTKRTTKRNRKKFIPSLFLRFTMILVLVGGTSVLCWTALTNISRPYIIGAQQSQELSQKSQALAELDVDNAKIAQQCAYLSRPDGIENAARMKGFLKPGEQSLIMTAPVNGAQQ
jgi:cell division protein FtsB